MIDWQLSNPISPILSEWECEKSLQGTGQEFSKEHLIMRYKKINI